LGDNGRHPEKRTMISERQEKRARELIAFFEGSALKRTFGLSLAFDEELRACLELPYNPNLDSALNDTHGGIVGTLIDSAGWFAAAVRGERPVVTVEYHVRLLEPPQRSLLRAEGWLIREGKRLSVAEMKVTTADGRLIASGSGTFAVASRP
jgi:uncharacterized protein (TIGR00369 family)